MSRSPLIFALVLPALAALSACAPPFDVARKDLGPFRIAAMGVHEGQAHAAVWSGEGMAHAQAPTLAWSLDGETQHAADGQAVRVSLDNARGSLRWMSASGLGTVLELSETQADVLADEVVFENEEGAWVVAERELGEPGIYHQLVLDLDPELGNRWAWVDVAVGVEEPLIEHFGRLIPGDVTSDAGLMQATLRAVSGELELEALSGVEDLSTQDSLDCAPPDQAFRLDWVAEGRCGLDAVDGATVVLEIQ